MTAARLEEIRNRWIDTQGFAAQDVRDLLSALDAHREAVRVLGKECERHRYLHEIRAEAPQMAGEVAREWNASRFATDANPIASAAIKSAQEGQQ